MEQNDIQSQHISGQRWLIRKLIQNQQTKQIKACSAQLIEHPAAGFTSYLIDGMTMMILTMSFALASISVEQPVQPIEIHSPEYTVTDLDLGRYNDCRFDCTARVWTENDQYAIDVEFDYTGYRDSNGAGHSWQAIEVTRIEPKAVHGDEGEINAYLDRIEISNINDALESAISEKLGV